MKKILILKIAILIIFIFSIVVSIIAIPREIYMIETYILSIERAEEYAGGVDVQGTPILEVWKKNITYNIFSLIRSFIFVLFSGIICFIVWFKDAKILTENAIDRIHATKETLEEEKRAKLKREIAEKQAELEKMNNATDTE